MAGVAGGASADAAPRVRRADEPSASARTPANRMAAAALGCALALVTAVAQRLQVGALPERAALLHRLDVVDHGRRREYLLFIPTHAAQRLVGQHLGPEPLPPGRVVQLIGVDRRLGALLVVGPIALSPVLRTEAGLDQTPAPGKAADGRTRPRHRTKAAAPTLRPAPSLAVLARRPPAWPAAPWTPERQRACTLAGRSRRTAAASVTADGRPCAEPSSCRRW